MKIGLKSIFDRQSDKNNYVRSAVLGKRTPRLQISTDAYFIEDNMVCVMLGQVPELSCEGSSAAIVNDSRQIYLTIARTAADNYVAASSQCTHRNKPLVYDHESRLFRCASRKSAYKLDGSIVKGPVEMPLKTYRTHLQNGHLIIDIDT